MKAETLARVHTHTNSLVKKINIKKIAIEPIKI